ncbi:MAG: hypothetical protein ACFE96_09720 [Candidatus Hermodarchaeota archaeon]
MKKTSKSNCISLFAVVLLISFSLSSRINNATANGIGPSQIFNTNLTFDEYSKFTTDILNNNSINISLPSSSWSIQDIELNFTDIKFGKENKIIEDQYYAGNYSRVFYQNIGLRAHGLAMQLKLTEPTTIYGVEFFGVKLERANPTIINFEIRGYDTLNNKPNSSVYATMGINISTTEGWYRQIFPSAILLTEGNYFLVINGSNVLTVNDDRIWWYYNNINPSDSSLYSSSYDQTDQWTTGVQGQTFLHKLIQKVNTPVYPENINMTVNIDDHLYQISNSTSEGKGFLSKTTVDFTPNSDHYQIIVDNQASKSLLFNVSYHVTLSNNFITSCSVVVQNGTSNKWSVKPTIIRQPTNYSISLNYPSSWENITVLKDSLNITSSVVIRTTERIILLLNDSITVGADWEITAYSPSIEFELNILRTEYNLGQEIEFLLQTPIFSGTYIFVLLDSAGIPVKNQTLVYPPGILFSYNLSLTDLDGTYTAYVFWFSASETNAGVQTQTFEISIYEPPPPPPTPPPDFSLPLLIGLIVLGAVIVVLVSVITVKRIQKNKRTKLEKFLSKCTDISNINDVIVIDTKSGIDIFSQSFGGRKLDTSLISGFLQAISNFGSTISEAAKESRTMTIEYKDSIVMQTDFVNLKLIVTLKETPSSNFKFIMEDLAYDIYKNYGEEIDKFTGILKPFHNMGELIEKHLNIRFLYPLEIVEKPKIKLNASEKAMVSKARNFMEESNFSYFYSLYLMPANTCTPKDYEVIFSLIEKGVFRPTKKELPE